ncbi:unnamed protein product [Anisakis simplex]|uniref:Kinesin motor domain-containing protein n=1 Tax=Anisakis simplex TaxID=6269 RepID=A0A0M3J7T2_ANISI|nr:unnamed protein product [Anisakis simplex]
MKKDESLRQSERLRTLYSSQNNDAEVSKLRELLVDYERRIDDTSVRLEQLNADVKERDGSLFLADLTEENNVLVEDNKQEREFSTLTKAKYDELKVKFEQSSSALIEKGKDCVRLSEEIEEIKADLLTKCGNITSMLYIFGSYISS